MKLELTPTDQIVTLRSGSLPHSPDGMQARVWEGTDEHGVAIHAFIIRVAVHESEPAEVHERFGRELQECAKPRPLATVPLSLII